MWYKTMKEVKHYLDRARSCEDGTRNMMADLYKKKGTKPFAQKYTLSLLLAYDALHSIEEAPTNKEFDDIDLPNAFPEAYNRTWWEDNILE